MPPTSVSASAGTNCARPIAPRAASERVSANTCQYTALRSSVIAVAAQKRLAR
jgi:hypothetical protein